MKIIIFFIGSIIPLQLFCQTISGKIENSDGAMIPLAHIVTKNAAGEVLIREFTIARNGSYSIQLKRTYTRLVVEVSAATYIKQAVVIHNPLAGQHYFQNFILIKDTLLKLPEIRVTAKPRTFSIKNDTVIYRVDSYREGSEKKIQDIIRKLPGMEVDNKTGEIRYLGKSVETVKLDGEDLFASNYAVGTKNINADMIEQVQAIENYSSNPLLKGIENSDKVALNLVLKKRKADYSGDIDIGSGLLGKVLAGNASANILGISKNYKSFATASFNNIGINHSIYDYFSYKPGLEQFKEADLYGKRYIPDFDFSTGLDGERSNINNAFFGSYNAMFKLAKKGSVKTNIYFLNDRIAADQAGETLNNINGQQIITSDKFLITKKPLQMRGDLELKYIVSQKSLLEYTLQYKKEAIRNYIDVVQNDTGFFNTKLFTADEFLKQSIFFTKKISKKKVLQYTARHTFNTVPQGLSFLPALYDPGNFASNNQSSAFRKSNILVQAGLQGVNAKDKYAINAGYVVRHVNYSADFTGDSGSLRVPVNGFRNDFTYSEKILYANANYRLQVKRFSLTPFMSLSYLGREHTEKLPANTRKTYNWLAEPGLSGTYKISNTAAFLFSAGYRQKPFSEEYLIEHPVFVSNRAIQSNKVSLNIKKTNTAGLLYIINNLYRQFQLNLGINYAGNSGGFFTDLSINQNRLQAVYFFLPESNSIFTFNGMIEKYVGFLQSTVRYRQAYSRQSYKNVVNGSGLRTNHTSNFSGAVFLKTAFDGAINLENNFQYSITNSRVKGGSGFANKSFNNNFQLIGKPAKGIFMAFSTDYFRPYLHRAGKGYLFLDVDINYQTGDKMYALSLKARNISNNQFFTRFETNDYSLTSTKARLLPKHFVVSVSRNF